MSTRGQTVFIKDIELKTDRLRDIEKNAYCIVYHHWDSYPDGVGEVLKKGIEMSQNRIKINDIEYATMNIINYLTNKSREDIEKGNVTGFGICNELYDDIEYIYIINMTTKELKCYEYDFGDHYLGELVFTYQF